MHWDVHYLAKFEINIQPVYEEIKMQIVYEGKMHGLNCMA